MVTNWKLLRERNPEKYQKLRKKGYINYVKRKLEKNPLLIRDEKFRRIWFGKLTRLLFGDILPKKCSVCGTREDLQIHHIKYVYPIKKEDLIRLCRRHHIEEHQRI